MEKPRVKVVFCKIAKTIYEKLRSLFSFCLPNLNPNIKLFFIRWCWSSSKRRIRNWIVVTKTISIYIRFIQEKQNKAPHSPLLHSEIAEKIESLLIAFVCFVFYIRISPGLVCCHLIWRVQWVLSDYYLFVGKIALLHSSQFLFVFSFILHLPRKKFYKIINKTANEEETNKTEQSSYE